MTSDDVPAKAPKGTGRRRVGPDPGRDDWLLDVGSIDWFAPAPKQPIAREERSERRPRRRQSAAATSDTAPAPETEVSEVIRRRRFIGLVALFVIVAAAVAVPVMLLGGNSKLGPPVATGVTTTTTPTTVPTTTPTTTTGTTPTTTTPTTPTTTGPTTIRVVVPASGSIKPGDTGSAVKQLQQALTKLGYDVGKADGVYGPSTKAAVVSFQKKHGLTADGIVGKQTAKAMNAALAAL